MIKIAGIWEQGWNTPIKEYDLWWYMLREFDVNEFIMTPVSGIDADVTEMKSLEDAIKANPELTVVHVDEDGESDLLGFTHPENALYVFGRTSNSSLVYKTEGHLSVRIPTPNNFAGFWANQVAALVLYDRYLKS